MSRVTIAFKYVNMADINSEIVKRTDANGTKGPVEGTNGIDASTDSDVLMSCVELLFFAYRDFTGDPDTILEEYGFGRAHHRVLHFVNRNPGLRVADLLDILKITKQSLARVLKQLVESDFIEQKHGAEDRRERLLYTTDSGAALAERLVAMQLKRIETALAAAGADAQGPVRDFLFAMIKRADREEVAALIGREIGTDTARK